MRPLVSFLSGPPGSLVTLTGLLASLPRIRTGNCHIVHGVIAALSPQHPVDEEEEDHEHGQGDSEADVEGDVIVSVGPGCCKM